MTPLVSVIIAVYNGERFLREAVESVLRQTLSGLELVVVDDGSTDSTPDILAEYATSDSRLVVRRQQNSGQAAARNAAFGLARAELIAVLDADDVADHERLERQLAFLVAHDSVAVVGGAVTFIDEDGRPFAEAVRYPPTDAEIRTVFSNTNPFAHSAVLMRKQAFSEAGGYRPLFVPAEDIDLWLRIAERHELANLPETVVRYRVHAGQATVEHLELQTLCSVAARVAARTRAARGVDPLDGVTRIDRPTLLALGATEEEITTSLVHTETWLALTTGRAGYAQASADLFADALERAQSSGSRELIAHVEGELARQRAGQTRRLRGRLRAMLRK